MSKSSKDIQLSLKINGIAIEGLNLADPQLDLKKLENKLQDTKGLDNLAKAEAAACLADGYHYGIRGVSVNITKAYHYYYLAGLAGHRSSQFNAAYLILEYILQNNGSKPKLDIQKPTHNFIRFLTMSAEGTEGLTKAKHLLAKTYFLGSFGIPKNGELCFKYFNEITPVCPEAYYYLGHCYDQGFGTKQDLEQAAISFQKGANEKDPGCLNALGAFYKDGKGNIVRDKKRAAELFEQAIALGSYAAKLNLGVLYVTGDGVERDCDKGLKLLHEVAQEGNVEAQKYLGSLYMGNDYVKRDEPKMFHYSLLAAKNGDMNALFNVGKFYLAGMGCDKNENEGFRYLNESHNKGYGRAKIDLAICYLNQNYKDYNPKKALVLLQQYLDSKDNSIAHRRIAERYLGLIYMDNCKGIKKDRKKAFDLLKSAADAQDAEAIASLGIFYMSNDVVPRDYARARQLFESMLSHGYQFPNAINHLVKCLVSGLGGPTDKPRAFQLLKSVESSNSAKTNEYLALCYLNGWGTERDVKKTIECLELSIKMGNFDAEMLLAGLYLQGNGVPKDIPRAIHCFKKGLSLNNAVSKNVMAICYLFGLAEQSKKNTAENAFKLILEASLNSVDALNNLGWCYLNGIGTERNPVEAVKCFEKARLNGSLSALQNLGWCLLNGFGIEKDVKKAQAFFMEARKSPNHLQNRNQMGFTYLCYYGGDAVKDIFECSRIYHQNGPEISLNLLKCCVNGWGGFNDQKDAFQLFQQELTQLPEYQDNQFRTPIVSMKAKNSKMDSPIKDLKPPVSYPQISKDTELLWVTQKAIDQHTRKKLSINGRQVQTESLSEILKAYRAKTGIVLRRG